MADIQLRRLLTDVNSTTFSCSLVVGASTDGAISRFNGVYPMLKAMALYNPPAIIGDPETPIDLVPIDWVAENWPQSASGPTRRPQPDVMASAGEQAGTLGDLMGTAEDRIASFRMSSDTGTIGRHRSSPVGGTSFCAELRQPGKSRPI